jgi:nicotinamide-nucleotide amidase
MRVTVLTIGDEIVSGHTLDTNAAYLSGRLAELGFRVGRIVSVGDRIGEVRAELEAAIADSDLVLVTGGLGPTHDDVTKQALAEAAGVALVLDRDLHALLKRRFAAGPGVRPEVIESLSTVPQGARALENPLGAAAGLEIGIGAARVYAMPGVPREMEAVFDAAIADELDALPKRCFSRSRVIRTIGLRESEITEKLEHTVPSLDVDVGFLPGTYGVDLRLVGSGSDGPAATEKLEKAARLIENVLGMSVYSTEGEDLHDVVGKMLIARAVTIAVAESCTGGLISHLLTQVPGISASFERGDVTYSNRAKIDCLGVGEALIRDHGAVSREVAEAMARGVRQTAGTDIGISTTGIAGPTGGSEPKPVGLVYVGLAHDGGCAVKEVVFRGTRRIVKLRAAMLALDLARRHLSSKGV